MAVANGVSEQHFWKSAPAGKTGGRGGIDALLDRRRDGHRKTAADSQIILGKQRRFFFSRLMLS